MGHETVWLTGEVVEMIDQRLLPHREEVLCCRTCDEVGEAIRDMTVRGAPAIGVAAAMGMYLAAREAAAGPADEFKGALERAAERLRATRPTAVNLSWAVDRQLKTAAAHAAEGTEAVVRALRQAAVRILTDDIAANRRLGALGAEFIADGDGVLTHCNAGSLATGGFGTALGVIRAAWEQGKKIHVFADETRPRLQGARLTAWELRRAGIPHTVIPDNTAAHLMRLGRIQVAVVGADRICANGDVANKIGTYAAAICAREHGIPFFVAAPFSTVDMSLKSGEEIPIEQRGPEEVTQADGAPLMAPDTPVANYAFDVTPARFIAGIITEHGVARAPYTLALQRIEGRARQRGDA